MAEDFDSALTELTLTAARAGRLPAVTAVRARGDQRRHRQQTQLTALSVVLLTGIATSLLSTNVIGSAEQAPMPAHSGPTAPLPVPSTSHPTSSRPVPAATPTSTPQDAAILRKLEIDARLKAGSYRKDADKLAAASSSKEAARQRRVKLGPTSTTSDPTPRPTSG